MTDAAVARADDPDGHGEGGHAGPFDGAMAERDAQPLPGVARLHARDPGLVGRRQERVRELAGDAVRA